MSLCSWSAGVASGATRAALTQHFALENNAADISAKVQKLLYHFSGESCSSVVACAHMNMYNFVILAGG